MNVKTIIFFGLFCLLVGLGAGFSIHSAFFCADANKGIVKQIKSDGKKLTQVKKEVRVKYVYRTKIKEVVKQIPSSECFDMPVPVDASNLLFRAFDAT